MIRFLPREEIDSRQWDDCVRSSPEFHVFVRSWYLDSAAPGWSAYIYNDYTAVFPVFTARKMGVDYIYQPFFTRHFGTYSHEGHGANFSNEIFKRIRSEFRYVDLCLHPGHTQVPEGFKGSRKIFQLLGLDHDYETIRKKYSQNLIRLLRKAEESELKIVPDLGIDLLTDRIQYLQKDKRKELKVADFLRLNTLMHSAQKQSNTRCWGVADSNEQILAAAFFIEEGQRILYLKGYSEEEGRKNGAMHFLFDRLIRSQSGSGKILDFGGSNVESVARFYHHFGAVDSVYLQIGQNRLPPLAKWLSGKRE